MTYLRVIPRDLFNEANLLKCHGQLYLNIETLNLPGVELVHEYDDEPFDIAMDPNDGSLMLLNVRLWVHGEPHILFRPLNSREPWPLYLDGTEAPEPIAVFTDTGKFTAEFESFLKSQPS